MWRGHMIKGLRPMMFIRWQVFPDGHGTIYIHIMMNFKFILTSIASIMLAYLG